LDELKNLLGQLELGAAADSIYDMIMDLDADRLTLTQLEHAIRSIFALHGFEACADAVIAALQEVGFADGEGKAAGPRTEHDVGCT
jgi:hypothetical protein